MLCKFCTEIDLDALEAIDGYQHHPRVRDLQDSASSGCELCILIWAAHREHEGGFLDDHWLGSPDDTPIRIYLGSLGLIEVLQPQRRKHNQRPFLNSILNFCTPVDDPAAARIFHRPVNLPPASVGCFQTASTWLQACLEHHVDCTQDGAGYQSMPTRVIDVGPPDGSMNPFLYCTNGTFGQWVALSHCWGGADPLKTTSETIANHQASLPFTNLPPLFRDAVLITRRLNHRYLWIDSLCIIQDSDLDWQTESANMGYIYSNAVFTVAAEECSSSKDSILNNSQHAVTYPVKVSCYSDEFRGTMLLYRARHDIKGPLSRRAWTLQEDVLSTRVLRWGAKQLTWHCRTVTCSEHDPTGAFNIDSRGYFSGETLYRKPDFKLLCLNPNQLQRRLQGTQIHKPELSYRLSSLYFWDTIVRDFVSRALTYDTDRLAAMSGVAKEVARHSGYTYKAGLWEEEFHSNLCWWAEGKTQTPPAYTAPSWSWAGHTMGDHRGKLNTMSAKFNRHPSQNISEILSIDLVYVGPDIYGQVTSGQLLLRAPCLEMRSWDSLSRNFDCLPDTDPRNRPHLLCIQVLNFPTRKWFSGLRKRHFEGEICALVLEPTEDTDNHYQRVGLARIPVIGQGERWETRTVTII